MKRRLFYKVMYDFFSFFWLQKAEKLITWIIPLYAIHGVFSLPRFCDNSSLQIGTGNAKSLHRPVARNGISVRLSKKGESHK